MIIVGKSSLNSFKNSVNSTLLNILINSSKNIAVKEKKINLSNKLPFLKSLKPYRFLEKG